MIWDFEPIIALTLFCDENGVHIAVKACPCLNFFIDPGINPGYVAS